VVVFGRAERMSWRRRKRCSKSAALGAHVAALGVIGEDEPGRALRACLRAAGIADAGVIADKSRVTTVKDARHCPPSNRLFALITTERAVAAPLEEKVFRQLVSALKKLDGLVLSTMTRLDHRCVCPIEYQRLPSLESSRFL